MSFEFMQIRQMETGEIVFLAQPSGGKATSFALKSWGKKEVVFENSTHDFPERVIYRLRKDGSLLGRIEGVRNGKNQTVVTEEIRRVHQQKKGRYGSPRITEQLRRQGHRAITSGWSD